MNKQDRELDMKDASNTYESAFDDAIMYSNDF